MANRIIKFRGQRLDNREWVYGSLIVESLVYGNKYSILTLAKDEDDKDKTYEVYYPTIGQFTGLLDKNGKEIYEGDILRSIDEDVTVFYNTATACFDIEWAGGDCETLYSFFDNEPNTTTVEVIGNIYETLPTNS